MRYLNIGGYIALPLAFGSHYLGGNLHWEPLLTFILAAIGTVPLARLMGIATERLAAEAGPTWGGLLNATFGNAAELIIAIIALTKGLNSVVKATLTGSIIGNLLLVGGASMVVGGWRRLKQTFSREAGEANAGLLVLAVVAMLFPAIFHYSALQMHDPHVIQDEHKVSIGCSVVLLIAYGLGLLFTLRTHAHVFSTRPAQSPEEKPGVAALETGWTLRRSVIMLLVSAVAIALIAELLVGAAEELAAILGWSEIFIGVILLAIIGNAAEHSTAMFLAARDDMDTALAITQQSSLQIAIFIVPLLVLLSAAMAALGWQPQPALDLIFTPMEVAAVLLCVGIVVLLGLNGETNWFEGALLLAVYCILGIGFFYIPTPPHGGYDGPQTTLQAPQAEAER